MLIQYKNKQCHTRSNGLVDFLDMLVKAYPSDIALSEVEGQFRGISPRQIARYIDKLEQDGVYVVGYRTKTCGPFRLNVKPTDIELPRSMRLREENQSPPKTKDKSVVIIDLEILLAVHWITWAKNLTQASLCLNNSYSNIDANPFVFLKNAQKAAEKLPSWTSLVVSICRAYVLERKSQYGKAISALRCLDSIKNHGSIPDNILVRGRLCEAKIFYDQGRYQESEEILAQIPESIKYTPPLWLNIHALNLGQKFLRSSDHLAKQRDYLTETLSALTVAFSDVFLMHGDSSLLDALSFNIGNNLLRGIRKGVVSPKYVDLVLEWFSLSIFISRELGTGSHSVLTQLLVVDVIEEFGNRIGTQSSQYEHLFKSRLQREKYLELQLENAEQTGNRLERAECLLRLGKITSNRKSSLAYFQKAKDLATAIKHKNLTNEINIAVADRLRSNEH